MDAALVQEVFGLPARVIEDPVTGTPLCLPAGRRARAGSPPAPETQQVP